MKALEEINAKELKAVVKELNESGVLPKKIRLVGISVENLVKEFSKAIEELPEDAKVPQMAADFYNDLYEDEIEDDDSDVEESEDDSEDDESDEDESDEDEDDPDSEEGFDDGYSDDEEDESDDDDPDSDDEDESDDDDDDDDDVEDSEDEPEEEPEEVKPPKKESKKKEPKAPKENKPKKETKPKEENKPKKEVKPKEEVPSNTKVSKEQQAKVKKIWGTLTKKSNLFDLDLAVVKALLANPKISPKDLCEAVTKDIGEDFEKVKREATKIISALHYLIGNYPESKEKSKMNRAVQMVLEGENPKFIHSSTVIVIKRMIQAYGATTGLKFKEA